MRVSRQFIPFLLAIAVLLFSFRIWVPNFLATENLIDLAQQISVNAIIAFGMTLVILIGGIDLSVGALLAFVGTLAVFLLDSTNQLFAQVWIAIPIAIAAAGALGAANGTIAAKTKIPPFIITLATMLVARGAALSFNQGRPIPIPESQTAFLHLGNGRIFNTLPVPVLVMLLAFCLMGFILHFTRFGRHLYAIGGNAVAARFSGIPIARDTVIVYVLCSVLAGIAGMIHTSQLYSAEPSSGAGFELNAIAAVAVGGTSFSGGFGTMPGTLAGAVMIGILDKGLNQAGVHFSLQYVAKGLVILGAVFLDVLRRK